jgi:hypothetical protein
MIEPRIVERFFVSRAATSRLRAHFHGRTTHAARAIHFTPSIVKETRASCRKWSGVAPRVARRESHARLPRENERMNAFRPSLLRTNPSVVSRRRSLLLNADAMTLRVDQDHAEAPGGHGGGLRRAGSSRWTKFRARPSTPASRPRPPRDHDAFLPSIDRSPPASVLVDRSQWDDGKGSHHPDYDPTAKGPNVEKASRETEELLAAIVKVRRARARPDATRGEIPSRRVDRRARGKSDTEKSRREPNRFPNRSLPPRRSRRRLAPSPTPRAAQNDIRLIYKKIEEGADVNFVFGSAYGSKNGYTPLMSAAHRGRLEASRALLRSGADPNFMNRNGDLTLFWAVDGGVEIIKLFVDYGVDLDARTAKDWTALSYARAAGKYGLVDEKGIYPEDVLRYYGATEYGSEPEALGVRSPRESFNPGGEDFSRDRGSYQREPEHP